MIDNLWIYDIETFSNCFSLVAKRKSDDQIVEFVIWEDDRLGQARDLFEWMYSKPVLVGYNNINFDGQIIEEIWQKGLKDAREIYAFTQFIIETKDSFKLPYKQWTFTMPQLDLMQMNNFGIYGKPTSLKWLEFVTRNQTIQDMPKKHYESIEEGDIKELLRYNRLDVEMTDKFYDLFSKGIDMRRLLTKKFNDDLIMNQSNPSIGEKIVLYSYCDQMGLEPKDVKRKSTKRTEIPIKDVIVPFISFNSPIFKEVKKEFEELVLKANKDGVIQLKGAYEKQIEFQDMNVTYALGGIHGCVESGIYRSSDTHVIKSYDVTSMYPNIAISNKFYPEHLGEGFCVVYDNILKERRKYPKDTDFELNAAYKEAANSVNV